VSIRDGVTVSRRVARPGDAAYVDALLLADARDELAGVPEPVRSDLATMQVRARRFGYASDWPRATDWIVLLYDEPAGRLLVDDGAEHVHVVDVRLEARHRGRGVGTAVLRELCAHADLRRVPVTLTARVGSPAERWYRRLGFVDVERPTAAAEGADADVPLVRPPAG
jgi:GNAT superfamily N-acetyltransferase